MFDLTTIQIINMHPSDLTTFRTRDLIRPKNIQEAWESAELGAMELMLIPDPIVLLDNESVFSPPAFTGEEWEERQCNVCCHCLKRFKVAAHDPTDTWTCSQECRDAWVPF